MTHFSRRNGHLHAEQVRLAEIAERFGTPTYVYSRAALREHFLAYEQALAHCPHLICYAVKANSNIGVLNVLAQLGAGFDIVSVGELERVLLAGGDPAKIVFSGVGKQPAEMARALDVDILCFNVESAAELATLNQVAGELGRTARVSLRINPDVNANTHAYIATGLRENKFGIDIADAVALYRQAQALPNLKIIGVDCHIGSQLTDIEPFLAALDRILLLVDQLAAAGIAIEHLDLGGGLGVRYRDETPPPIASYIAALRQRLGNRGLTLVLEPGRSIVANAGVLLTKITYLKHIADKNFAIVDAAMNDLIRPALYQAWMAIDAVEQRSQAAQIYDVVGPVCETGDFLGKNRRLAIAAGDLLCVHSAGAYGFTMSSNYNSRPRAAEVMVDGARLQLVRERETLADLVRGEHVPAE
ncbi:MAG: diaminopimelate decarboxylase [Porticoccaceae bacterium]